MATYGMLDRDQVVRALEMFAMPCLAFEHMSGGSNNTSYLVESDLGRFVLTVVDNATGLTLDRHSQLLTHLHRAGTRVALPVPTADGAPSGVLDGQAVMLKRLIEGTVVKHLPDHYLVDAGAELARIHQVSAPAWLPSGLRRLDGIEAVLPDFGDRTLVSWLMRRIEQCHELLNWNGPSGIVHGDYFADNLVVQSDGRIAVLDWEYASRDLLLIDIGLAVVGLCREDNRLSFERLGRFLTGYQSLRPLLPAEVQLLKPAVLFGASNLAFIRYVRHNLDHVSPEWGNWYREMVDFGDDVDARMP